MPLFLSVFIDMYLNVDMFAHFVQCEFW